MINLILAAKISVWLFYVTPPPELADTMMSKQQALATFREAAAEAKEVGADIKITRFRTLKLKLPLNAYREEWQVIGLLSNFYNIASKQNWMRHNRIVYFLTPRSPQGYMFGASYFRCVAKNRGSISFSTAQDHNTAGDDRAPHTLIGIKHELYRDLGATTTDSGTIMDLGVLKTFNEQGYIDIDPRTYSEINTCLNIKTRVNRNGQKERWKEGRQRLLNKFRR